MHALVFKGSSRPIPDRTSYVHPVVLRLALSRFTRLALFVAEPQGWLLTRLAKASSLVLRLSVGFQKEAVSKAYQDFVQLWLSDFDGGNIPNVSVLCALAVACRALPDNLANSLICSFWKRETQKLATQASFGLRICFCFGVMGGT